MKKKVTKTERKVGAIQYIIAVILIVVVGLFALVGVMTDFLWFQELGYISVFFTRLIAMLQIGVPIFVVVAILSFIYLRALKKNYFKKFGDSAVEESGKKTIGKITIGLALVVALVTAIVFTVSLWFELLMMTNSTSFDLKDPIFNLDISFYIFQLDFWTKLNGLLIIFLLLYIAMTVIYYLILMSFKKPSTFENTETFKEEEKFTGGDFKEKERNNPFKNTPFGDAFGKAFEGFGNRAPRRPSAGENSANETFKGILSIAKGQIIVIGSVIFLMIAANFFLRQFELLFTSSGVVHGPGYTEVNVTLWMYRALMVIAVFGIIGLVIAVKKNRIKPVVIVPILMVVVAGLGTAADFAVQRLIVTPDELNKEREYLESNIEYTQYAYDLDEVTIKSFGATTDLTSEDIAANSATIDNIRINDYAPAKQFYIQTESIRQYYTFNDVDVDRYMIDGEYTQTFLATREIDEEKITDTWLNRHIKYTHGYGIVMSRVNEVTPAGQPEMIVGSIPPSSTSEEIEVTRPEIYFGELSNNYSVVGTNETEFDYPDGDSNKYTEYEGSAGIKLNLLNRLLFAIDERSLNILVSSNIDSKSKIIVNKNIMARVEKIMPYLEYENDPYMVVIDGKLYWVIDAYTSSSKFPYSEPYNAEMGTNYISNSVKVVIDAYNGDTNYYVVDEEDPIALTLQKIYPDLFKDADELSDELKAHLRYPAELLQIQAEIYKRYHMDDANVFYQNEDVWDIAKEVYGTEEATYMTPNYYILNLPGEANPEFINSIPFTPKDKRNLTGLMMARNDGENYGELVLFQLPKDRAIDGPEQIEAKINQDTEIAADFTLWESAGTTYTRGNMFVVPIEDSLLYVEPIYLEATNSSIPEVKRVVVAYGDTIAYEETLDAALESLFGEGSQRTSSSQSSDTGDSASSSAGLSEDEIIAKTLEAFNAAEEAQRNGDWAAYGNYMDQVSSYLNQLSK